MKCHFFRGSLLEFLVAGQLEDPPDTFQKILDRDMTILVPKGTIYEKFFRESPFDSMRVAFQKAVLEKDGLVPFGINSGGGNDKVLAGEAGMIYTKYTIMGKRHLFDFSREEWPIASFPHSFLYAKGSDMFHQAEPLVLRLIEAGVYKHLEFMYYWDVTRKERDHYRSHNDDKAVVLGLEHLGMICPLIVGTGIGLALIAFLFEVPSLLKSIKFGALSSYFRSTGIEDHKYAVTTTLVRHFESI